MRFAAALAAIASAAGVCPDLATLRSPAVSASWDVQKATGVWFENRYTDLAQIGARCQQMNKAVASDGISISEDYRVLYGTLPFDLPLIYNASGLPLGVSNRYLSLTGPAISFPSVVVDFTVASDGSSYDTLTEYLCWDVLGIDYVEVRLSTRTAVPAPGVLDAMQAKAVALGVKWVGNLTDVSFTGCPAWNPNNSSTPAPSADAFAETAALTSPYVRNIRRLAAAAHPATHLQWVSEEARDARLYAPAAAGDVPPKDAAMPLPCDPSAIGTDLILPGLYPGKPQVALVFIQGALVPTGCYAQILYAIQVATTDFNVIVGAPASSILNTPNPLTIGGDIARIVNLLEREAGVDNRTAKWVYAAHSLGGQMIQEWLANNTIPGAVPSAVALFGSYVTRQFRNPDDSQAPYMYPTLSMCGELDGMARVTRLAESYWHQQEHSTYANKANFPVIVIPGMNHGQFGSYNGSAPGIIPIFDLDAEVSVQQAQSAAAAVTAAFIQSVLGGNATAASFLQAEQESTASFLAPLVASQELEASTFYIPPCDDNPPSPACQLSCPFSPHAQALLSNAAGSNGSSSYAFSMNITDAMHNVDDIVHFHLPNITNNCSAPTSNCVLNASTVTQNTYDSIWSDFDIALYPVTAHETRIKMTSRQKALYSAGLLDANFTVLDQIPNLCADVNAATLNWAIQNAGAATAARYSAKGIPIMQGADTDAAIGPEFTYGSLNYTLFNATQSPTGQPFVQLGSTTLRTPIDYWLPISAGYHYCLLLSPARAMEWVYIDSLRPFLLD